MGRGKPLALRGAFADDCAALLGLLPVPYFSERDAADIARALGFNAWEGLRWWRGLVKFKKIERTNVRMGRSQRRCYWTRTSSIPGTPLAENLP